MVINTLQFTLDLEIKDNFPIPIVSPQLGSEVGQYQANVGYDGYALSSIYIDGVSEQLGQYANCIVFGFMRWPRQ